MPFLFIIFICNVIINCNLFSVGEEFMNVYVQRTVSLFLILFVALLGLDYFQIITFNSSLRSSLYVITFILLIVSSTVVVCSGSSFST